MQTHLLGYDEEFPTLQLLHIARMGQFEARLRIKQQVVIQYLL